MDKFSFLNAAHTAYFADLYDQYLQNPDSVEPSWRAFFQGYDFGSENYGLSGEIVEGVSAQIPEHVQKEFHVVRLIDGYRMRGHLFTKTNPVRDRRTYSPTLAIENFDLIDSDLADFSVASSGMSVIVINNGNSIGFLTFPVLLDDRVADKFMPPSVPNAISAISTSTFEVRGVILKMTLTTWE